MQAWKEVITLGQKLSASPKTKNKMPMRVVGCGVLEVRPRHHLHQAVPRILRTRTPSSLECLPSLVSVSKLAPRGIGLTPTPPADATKSSSFLTAQQQHQPRLRSHRVRNYQGRPSLYRTCRALHAPRWRITPPPPVRKTAGVRPG